MNEDSTAPVRFFAVALACEAAPHLGCGPIAAPVLAELEEQPGIREAWLNRKGTVLGVSWAGAGADPRAVIRTLGERGISASELESAGHHHAHETFVRRDGWYRPAQLQALSAEEAQVIAARLVGRLRQSIALSSEAAERLKRRLEQACELTLAEGAAAAVGIEVLRERIAAALLDAGRDSLDPAAFGAFEAALALGHRPLTGEE